MGNFVFSQLTETEKSLPYYLVGVGCDYDQEDIHRPFGYPYFQWIQTLAGCGELVIGEQRIPVPEHHGMLLYPEEQHAYHRTEQTWLVHWFTFGGYHIKQLLQMLGIGESGVYRLSDPHPVDAVIRQGIHMLESSHALRGMDNSVVVYNVLMQLMKYVHTKNAEAHHHRASPLQPVLDYIGENYMNAISIEELAGLLSVTPQHLCHLFKEIMGYRPVEFLTTYRINRSKEILLKEPELPISAVAQRVGYGSTSYFGAVFRKVEGISPSDYRQVHSVPERQAVERRGA
jgi:AraC-like DNA-binding protein